MKATPDEAKHASRVRSQHQPRIFYRKKHFHGGRLGSGGRIHIAKEANDTRQTLKTKFVAGTSGAALSAMIVPRHVLGGVGYNAPSDTVNFALIGCGGQGKTDSGRQLYLTRA